MIYLKQENFEVEKIEVSNYDFVRIIPQVNYVELDEKYSIPSVKECFDNDYWIAEKDCIIHVHLKSGHILHYTIKKGYITDFASVPKFFRNIISNDSVVIILPSVIHDVNFGSHYFGFKDSNILLKEMCDYYGMGAFKRNAVYYAVKMFGRSHFSIKHKEIEKNKKFFSLSITYGR